MLSKLAMTIKRWLNQHRLLLLFLFFFQTNQKERKGYGVKVGGGSSITDAFCIKAEKTVQLAGASCVVRDAVKFCL